MDRRLLLAIGLMLIVAVLPSILWPPERPSPDAAARAGQDSAAPRETPQVALAPETVFVAPEADQARPTAVPTDSVPLRIVDVESDLYRYEFSSRGARLTGAALRAYRSFAPGDSGTAQVIPDDSDFLAYKVIVGSDTVALADWTFEPDREAVAVPAEGEATLNWSGRRGNLVVRLAYVFRPGTYMFDVRGEVEGVDAAVISVGLGPRLRSVDADTGLDIQAYGVVTKSRSTERLNFSSLDPDERRELTGPFEWVAIKSKYFVAAVFADAEGQPRFGGVVAVGRPRTGRLATEAGTVASLPAPGGRFSHSVWVGPQESTRLKRVGRGFDDVNPYGWFLRPVIRPFVNYLIMPVLLWMHQSLNLAYGWVLILFGIMVRLVLWPLNQKAMRASTAMQAIQPEVKALQERHKQDPAKLQQEMMKLYKLHGVNPLGGCLPMLIPMPVLFALFFVFANTIEFRGVEFLWLPDLSRADPLYIIPILMGASMYAVTKLGQRGVPPNPQAKMMTYIMPPLFTLLFLKFSAGLNLYYAVSNLASIPQQWMISNERIARLGPGGGKGGGGPKDA